jgi:uncharacterized protein (TIGR02147 family)
MEAGTSLFAYDDYKAYFRDRAGGGRTGFKALLAQAAGIHPGLVSKVLKGDLHFTVEQAYAIARKLGMPQAETNFLLLLLQRDRAGNTDLKAHFQNQIDSAVAERMDFQKRLAKVQPLTLEQQSQYYSYWYYAAIHVAITIPRLRTADALAQYFHLPIETVSEVLEFLVLCGMAKENNGTYSVGSVGIHLDKNSHFISRHHTNWRAQALHKLHNGASKDVHYAVAVSLSEQDFDALKDFLMEKVREFIQRVDPSPEETVAALVLDFFKY